MKKALCVLVILLLASFVVNIFILTRQPEVKEKRDTDYVVRWDTIHDSLPAEKGEKIIKYIAIPCSNNQQDSLKSDNLIQDSASNSLTILPIVQKKYTDDSTYTAYVSGPKINNYPKLDSINVLRKIIERNITETIIQEPHGLRLKVRPAFTAGYDPIHKTWGVMAGGAIVIDW